VGPRAVDHPVLSPAARVAGLVTRTGVQLVPDRARVLARLFVPGEELPADASRASPLITRVMGLGEGQSAALLEDVLARFPNRHVGLPDLLRDHFAQVSARLPGAAELSETQRTLLGAYFTAEYSVESASLCNPSMVAHPDQTGLAAGETRFVLSLRGVGEGHLSSIELRTGVVEASGYLRFDAPTGRLRRGAVRSGLLDKQRVAAQLVEAGQGGEIAALILAALPSKFTGAQFEAVLASLHNQVLTRHVARDTVEGLRTIAAAHYIVEFPSDSSIDERILFPQGPTEGHGMEDARFVRFTRDDHHVTYYATYTAFDGAKVAPQLIQTDDFATFEVSQLSGPAATNKGLALFPRPIGGRFAALSRWDREQNALTFSDDAWRWEPAVTIGVPKQPWELIQIGNCGSPIETSEGWLILTHGVGPMRTYSIGAMLVDLDEPWRVRAVLTSPLMVPEPAERDGYVPNVLYSCGAMLHGETLVLPFAWSDYGTSVALVDLPGLLDVLLHP
jgi:predicted GH43/DUF377 family glycosyl hydrolase